MKLIRPNYTLIQQEPGLEGIYKQIELAGRTCYKSEDKITPDSAKDFVERMIKSGHGAMLEHGTVYLKMPRKGEDSIKYYINKYSKNNHDADYHYIATNYRVVIENNGLSDLQYQCEPTEFHEKRISVKFICDRGVSHEFVRHRVFSFAQESTRYCNYSKNKFDNSCTFIQPIWNKFEYNYNTNYESRDVVGDTETDVEWMNSCINSEENYFKLLNLGWTPQQARSVLPNSLKTELVMTGFISDWKHFFSLRDAGAAHPQARELAQPLHEEFKQLGYV